MKSLLKMKTTLYESHASKSAFLDLPLQGTLRVEYLKSNNIRPETVEELHDLYGPKVRAKYKLGKFCHREFKSKFFHN